MLYFYGIKATVGSGCVIAMHFCYSSCYFSCQHYHHQKQQTKQKTNAHFFLPVLYPCWSLVCFVASQQHRKIKPTAFLTLGFISCNGNFSVFFSFFFSLVAFVGCATALAHIAFITITVMARLLMMMILMLKMLLLMVVFPIQPVLDISCISLHCLGF